MRKYLLSLAALSGIVLATAPGARAADTIVQFDLTGIVFPDGSSLTGSFYWDATTLSVEDTPSMPYSIDYNAVTGGPQPSFQITQANEASSPSVFDDPSYSPDGGMYLGFFGPSQFLYIILQDPLTTTADNLYSNPYFGPPATVIHNLDCSANPDAAECTGVIGTVEGAVTLAVTPAPEPASIALLGTGFAGLGAIRRRRRR